MDQVGFVQAGIRIEREPEFRQLRASIERVLSPSLVEGLLRRVKRNGLRVRQFERIAEAGLFEQVDGELAASGKTARQLYGALSLSDQAQMREFYLTQVELIAPSLRAKYHTQFETF